MSRRKLIATTVALAVASLGVGAGRAAVPTPASGTTWAQNQAVGYRWKGGSEPPQWIRGAINAAATDSNESRAARAAILSYRDDAPSTVAYTADIPTNYAIGYAVRNIPDSFSVRLRPHGFVLDWGTLKWCQFYDNPPNGCYDAEMVTLHEFGHVQTLGHVDEADVEWLDSVMHAAVHSKGRVGWNMHAFGRCDVARLQIRYQALNSSTRYSTCLSVPSSLGMSVSDSSPAYGSNVSFTATLRVAADAPYAKLAGDPASGRSVVLQRRNVGDSTWSNYAEFTPTTDGTGRYLKTVKVTATYEWRARFVSPSDEGLDGSSSSVLRVNVGGCVSNCPLSMPVEETGGAR